MSTVSNPTKLILQLLWVELSRVELRWVSTILLDILIERYKILSRGYAKFAYASFMIFSLFARYLL